MTEEKQRVINGRNLENSNNAMKGMEDTVWRVGCYNINPTTPNGQKFFILHMLVLPLIPITALVIQNSVTMNTLLGYQARVSTIRRQVRGAMEIALFIQNIQEERAEVALYIFTNQSDTAHKLSDNMSLANNSSVGGFGDGGNIKER